MYQSGGFVCKFDWVSWVIIISSYRLLKRFLGKVLRFQWDGLCIFNRVSKRSGTPRKVYYKVLMSAAAALDLAHVSPTQSALIYFQSSKRTRVRSSSCRSPHKWRLSVPFVTFFPVVAVAKSIHWRVHPAMAAHQVNNTFKSIFFLENQANDGALSHAIFKAALASCYVNLYDVWNY